MPADGWDDLLNEAREALRRQEDESPNGELGDLMTPEPLAYFTGRVRGTGVMQTRDGTRGVYLVWDEADKPGFLYQHAKLVAQWEEVDPEIGDEILVLRGATVEFEKSGEPRETFPYVVRKRPCSRPLPGSETESGGADDDGIPF
jgi:hypothetical protein